MKRGSMALSSLMFAIGLCLCIVAVFAYVSREMTDAKKAGDTLENAFKLMEHATKRADDYSNQTQDRIETEDARYAQLRARVDEIEAKDRPMTMKISGPVQLDVIRREPPKPLPIPKPPLKVKPRGPRLTQ